MRTFLLSSLGFWLVQSAASASLIAHWTFDEDFNTFAPSTTGQYPGQVFNGTRVAGRIGSGALHLNGTNAYMLVDAAGSPLGLAETSYTIAWWQRLEGLNEGEYVYMRENGYAAFANAWSSPPVMNLTHLAHPDFAPPANSFWPTNSIRTGWQHFAVVYDGKTLQFYDNGMPGSSWNSVDPIPASDGPLLFGAGVYEGKLASFFRGDLDDFRIYDVALSTQEIRDIGPPPGLAVTRQPIGYRMGVGGTVTLQSTAVAISTDAPLTYQWLRNGSPIPGANSTSLQVTSRTPGKDRYQMIVRAGALEIATDEAIVETVTPAPPHLLLHYEFENDQGQRIADSTGQFPGLGTRAWHVPGRVGRFALSLYDGGWVRVPASGTELDLAGTPYTIAWWYLFSPAVVPTDSTQARAPENSLHPRPHPALFPWWDLIFTMGTDQEGYRAQALNGVMIYQGSTAVEAALAESSWQHIAYVFTGTSNLLYVGGELVDAKPQTESLIGVGGEDLFFGSNPSRNTFGVGGLRGAIDDFRIYNYALGKAEIVALANVPWPESSLTVLPYGADGKQVALFFQIIAPDLRVEAASSLDPNAAWAPLGGGSNRLYEFIDPMRESTRFYRLHAP